MGITRTREHILEDYSRVHFERIALDCNYAVDRPNHDYGVDLMLYTFDERGEPEYESIKIQLKATDNPDVIHAGKTISLTIEWRHLEQWAGEIYPVILVLFDKGNEIAYWIYVQRYLKENNLSRKGKRKTLNVHFDTTKALDSAAIRQFAVWKNAFNQRFKEVDVIL